MMSTQSFWLVLYAVVASVANAGAPDPCESPYDSVDFRFQLNQATKNVRGDFVGTFEIENTRFGKEVLLRGDRKKGGLSVYYPDVAAQFMDLNGGWVSFLHLPGSFFSPGSAVHLKPGAKVSFATDLPSEEALALGGRKFRILLRLAEPHICIASEPFIVLQKRGPVEGFVSEERSNNALQQTLEDSRR